jgi:hypothetical protein
MLLRYYEFDIEILYTDKVGWKEYICFLDLLLILLIYVYDMCTTNSYTQDTFHRARTAPLKER